MIPQINAQTLITKGMPLSPNFILDHLTSGAFHYVLGQWVPQFTALLQPGGGMPPIWQIVRNLQIGSDSFLEDMMKNFGSDLILRSGFLNNARALLGNTLDIQIKGFEGNMFNVAKDVQKIAKKAKDLELHFGHSSFIRINFDETAPLKSVFSTELPNIKSVDDFVGTIKDGIQALRGFI